MKDARLCSMKDIDPTTQQMTCGLKVNKMGKCAVLQHSLFTLVFGKIFRRKTPNNSANKQW